MKQPDPRAFLFDIQAACQRISEFTLGMTLQDYVADLKTRSAVERQLEIIGEAVGQMLKAFPDLQGELPEAPRIISFRNFLIHGYASVSATPQPSSTASVKICRSAARPSSRTREEIHSEEPALAAIGQPSRKTSAPVARLGPRPAASPPRTSRGRSVPLGLPAG